MTANVTYLKRFLERFGYLPSASAADATTAALKKYQRFHGLPATGKLDNATRAVMSLPRCGLPDPQGPQVQSASTSTSGSSTTGLASYVTSGTRWTSRTLTYAIAPAPLPAGLSLAQVEAAIADAFGLWAAPTGLRFVRQQAGSGAVDIDIKFATGAHGDGAPFDGPWNVLAHAFFPPPNAGSLAGDVHFDNAERWTVTLPTSGSAVDLVTVATHEIGHSLGLGHSSVTGAIMYPVYRGAQRSLAADDIAGIRSLYGSGGIVLRPTAQHQTDSRFVFLVGPNDDLFMVMRSSTGSGKTELHVLTAASGYQQFSLHTGTVLHETDATFDFAVASNRDLFAIKKRFTGSGTTEVHVLSAANSYQRFSLQTRTALHHTDDNWSFAVGANRDLIAITRRGLRGVEVHAITAASAYQRFGQQLVTPLPFTDTSTAFALAANGDVAAVRRTGSTDTVVDVLSAAARYQSFALRTTIPLRMTAPAFEVGYTRLRDLLIVQKSGTASGKTDAGVADI